MWEDREDEKIMTYEADVSIQVLQVRITKLAKKKIIRHECASDKWQSEASTSSPSDGKGVVKVSH